MLIVKLIKIYAKWSTTDKWKTVSFVLNFLPHNRFKILK